MTKKVRMSLASACWFVLLAIIIGIVAVAHFPRGADWHWLLPLDGFYHIPMMLAGTAFMLLVAFICLKCCRTNELRRKRLLVISIGITIVQMILMYSYYFFTDWDVQQVTGIAQAMAEGKPIDDFKGYFLWTPNNLFLSRIFALVFFLSGPLWGFRVALFPLLMIQCIGACLTALMLTQTAMHIWHKKSYAILTYVFYTLFVWLSPWWSIPYSDIWGLMVVVAILWTATTLPFKRMWLKVFIISFATILGYYIRPQTTFVVLSLLLVGLIRLRREHRKMKSILKPSAYAIAGIVTGFLVVHVSMIGCPLHLHTSHGLGPSHYLMLGANYQSIGIYSELDVQFSRSHPNKRDRFRAEMKETCKRYSALGVDGSFLLWGRKNLLNFSDGTFYWSHEGEFFFKEVPERSGPIAKFTRSLFLLGDGFGSHYVKWGVVATSMWFGILVLSLFAGWPKRKNSSDMDDSSLRIIETVMFTLLMLILFHTLCEARARYIFGFTPLFVLLAVEGVRRIANLPVWIRGVKENKGS